jgi:hypothetical protein
MNIHERPDFNFFNTHTGAYENLFSGLHLDEQVEAILHDRLQSLHIGPSREPPAPPPSSDEFTEEVTQAVREVEKWLDAIGRRVEPVHLDAVTEHLNGFANIERRIVRGNIDSLNRVRKIQTNIKTLMDSALRKQALEKCRVAFVGMSPSQRQEVVRALMDDGADDLPF